MNDLISRQDAIKAIEDLPNCYNGFSDTYDKACIIGTLEEVPSAQQWIPCEERLPEDDTDVLISYRYKEGEGDTRNIKIDITSYGTMYFGGNAVRDYAKNNIKYWRPPFQYFNSNYEVIAWMPLPESYRVEINQRNGTG